MINGQLAKLFSGRSAACSVASIRPRVQRSGAVVLATVAMGLVGCFSSSTTAEDPPTAARATADTKTADVIELGPQSGAVRLAAAQKVPGVSPVTVKLDRDGQSASSQWPDACALLTKEQVKAVVPGSYELAVKGAGPSGGSTRSTTCKWQLGADEYGSKIELTLFDNNSLMASNFNNKVRQAKTMGRPVYDGLADGTRCVWDEQNLNCLHNTWSFLVSGLVTNDALIDPNGSGPAKTYDPKSPELQQKWLVPIASLVGPVLRS